MFLIIPHLAACCSGFAIIGDTESKRACGMLTDHMCVVIELENVSDKEAERHICL